MRVIAGAARGMRLSAVPDGTRPLSDRAREGLFSSLGGSVVGSRVLDLFAGTGAIGIEALSRGADAATFVDSASGAIRSIRENLRTTGFAERAEIRRQDARRFIQACADPFDLVFADPPYAIEASELDGLLADLAARRVVAAGGSLVLTRGKQGYMPVIPIDFLADRRLSYGDAVILVFKT